MKKNSSFFRNALDLVLIALVSAATISAAQAADKIRYEEIFQRIPGSHQILENRSFTVVTIGGERHQGRRLQFLTDHVELFHGDSEERFPSEQIARIEIRQDGRYFHHIENSALMPISGAMLLCGEPADDWPCDAIATVVLSPVWAYTAVTAPLYLVADAIAFFLPPKVFEIVH
jgi:hypothetical protein